MKKESHLIEWKLNWRDEFIKWICGFANAHGGTLIIGRNDNGEIVGVDDAKKLLEDIPNKVRDILGIIVDVQLRKKKGKEFIEIRVDASPHPVSYKGQYHFRSGSTKQELKGTALDIFLLRKLGKHWDGVPMLNIKLKDLSKSAIKKFCQMAKESRRLDNSILKEATKSLLEKLGLYDGKNLKRAAILLFHPLPEKFVTGAYVKIGFFRSNSDLRFQDEINGDLFFQVDKILDLLFTKYLNANISYRGIQRIETFPVPEAALREAILNALIHKNYASGSPVQISVYPDKLMIWNSGTLPLDWTVEKLLGKHASEPFNPDIANTFFRAGLIEAWGRGYERILEACHESNAPVPQIRFEATGLWVEFSLSNHIQVFGEEKSSGKSSGESSGKKKYKQNYESTSESIISLMLNKPKITIPEIASNLGLSTRAIEKQLKQLREKNIIRRIGGAKGGSWEVLI